jgi:hypothetical protein
MAKGKAKSKIDARIAWRKKQRFAKKGGKK